MQPPSFVPHKLEVLVDIAASHKSTLSFRNQTWQKRSQTGREDLSKYLGYPVYQVDGSKVTDLQRVGFLGQEGEYLGVKTSKGVEAAVVQSLHHRHQIRGYDVPA